jgi:cytochrome P450
VVHARSRIDTATADYQAFCAGRLADPYPLLEQLRSTDPVHWSDQLDAWVITRYEDVMAGIMDRRMSSDRVAINMNAIDPTQRAHYASLEEHVSNWLGFTDPPKHMRMRRLVATVFTPARAEQLRQRIDAMLETVVARLVSHMRAAGRVDLVADYARALPSAVICEILGIPEQADYALESQRALDQFFSALIADRRRSPRDDVLTVLATVEEDGQRLSEQELLGLSAFLYVAGYDTTVGLIANGLHLLLTRPDQARLVRDDASALPSAIEEVLRFESPVQLLPRLAAEDLQVGGRDIRRGDAVILHLGAANRDPQRYPDPDRFDVRRAGTRHVAFGWGAHFCLGAPLARLEAGIAFERFIRELGDMRLLDEAPRWRQSMTVRCPVSLPAAVA